MDSSAVEYLESLDIGFLVLSQSLASNCSPRTVKNKVFSTAIVSTPSTIPPGPYVASLARNGQLCIRKVYALFTDYQEAFYNGVTENDDGSFSAVEVWNTNQYAPLIPVPSRLYSSLMDTSIYPLAGLRFALKDLMPVKGLILTGGSRAYSRLYDTPANETAPAVERLLGLGAVLLGRSKLTTFAYGAYAYQNMDYSVRCPCSPLQSPSQTCPQTNQDRIAVSMEHPCRRLPWVVCFQHGVCCCHCSIQSARLCGWQ